MNYIDNYHSINLEIKRDDVKDFQGAYETEDNEDEEEYGKEEIELLPGSCKNDILELFRICRCNYYPKLYCWHAFYISLICDVLPLYVTLHDDSVNIKIEDYDERNENNKIAENTDSAFSKIKQRMNIMNTFSKSI